MSHILRPLLLVSLLCVLSAGQTTSFGKQTTFGKTTVFPGVAAGVTWTLIQGSAAGAHNFTCTTTACSVTVSSTTAGNLLVVCWAGFAQRAGGIPPLTSNAASGDTFTHMTGFPQQFNYLSTSWELIDCFYRLSATGGATTVTITPTWEASASSQAQDIQFLEVHRSTSTATFDAQNSNTNNACTSCAAPTVTISGTADFCFQFGAFAQTPSAISGSYTNPATFDSVNVFGAFAGNLSVASYSAPNWTVGSATNSGANMGAACWD